MHFNEILGRAEIGKLVEQLAGLQKIHSDEMDGLTAKEAAVQERLRKQIEQLEENANSDELERVTEMQKLRDKNAEDAEKLIEQVASSELVASKLSAENGVLTEKVKAQAEFENSLIFYKILKTIRLNFL